jgi:hypothetical protein
MYRVPPCMCACVDGELDERENDLRYGTEIPIQKFSKTRMSNKTGTSIHRFREMEPKRIPNPLHHQKVPCGTSATTTTLSTATTCTPDVTGERNVG